VYILSIDKHVFFFINVIKITCHSHMLIYLGLIYEYIFFIRSGTYSHSIVVDVTCSKNLSSVLTEFNYRD
jgi:hypothetical protein